MPEAIKCPDGEYELLIPTDAVSVGGDIKVKVTGCEKISGKNLVSFELGDRIAYGVLDEEVKNGTIGIDVDLKKISIVGENGAAVVEAMPEKIDFEGKLLKEKVAEEIEVNGKTKKKKVIKFFLQVGDAKFGCPDDIFRKLVAAIGVRKVFGEELLFECGPYDLKLVYNDSENGISADVVEIADYGKEKFAVCETGGRKIYVGSENINTGSVRLVPEIDKLSIIQKDKSIRII